jgi:hypothetical protein
MLPFFCCAFLSYIACVAQVMGVAQEGIGLSISAIVMVIVIRWFSPPVAAVWALFLGLLLDGLGTGPLGAQASALIVLTALLPRIGFAEGQTSAWRWGWAAFLIAWWQGMLVPGIELIPRQNWPAFEDEFVHGTAVAALTGCLMTVCIALWNSMTRRQQWHGE